MDQLQGEAGDDLLIGGTTSYDADTDNLSILLSTWSSTASYDTRILQIQDKLFDAHLELQKTVFDDGVADSLTGGGDEGAAPGRRRQVRAEDLQRIGRGDRGAEALLEELAHQGANVSLAASLPRL